MKAFERKVKVPNNQSNENKLENYHRNDEENLLLPFTNAQQISKGPNTDNNVANIPVVTTNLPPGVTVKKLANISYKLIEAPNLPPGVTMKKPVYPPVDNNNQVVADNNNQINSPSDNEVKVSYPVNVPLPDNFPAILKDLLPMSKLDPMAPKIPASLPIPRPASAPMVAVTPTPAPMVARTKDIPLQNNVTAQPTNLTTQNKDVVFSIPDSEFIPGVFPGVIPIEPAPAPQAKPDIPPKKEVPKYGLYNYVPVCGSPSSDDINVTFPELTGTIEPKEICSYLNKKVIIGIAGTRLKVTICSVTPTTVRAFDYINARVIYINLAKIESVTPLSASN